MLQKQCMDCGEQATHKFTRIMDDGVEEFFYCEQHARDHNKYVQVPDVQTMINTVLKNLLEQKGGAQGQEAGESDPAHQVTCTGCGLSFADYRSTLLLGCSECYDSFSDLLVPELRKYHGSSQHTGRRPGRPAGERKGKLALIRELREQLEQAISREDFIEAARLRDEIKVHESGLTESGT